MHAQCKYKPVVADSGGAGGQGGPGGPGHPLFSDQTEARRAEKKLSSGLNDRSPPPPPLYLKVWMGAGQCYINITRNAFITKNFTGLLWACSKNNGK